MSYQFLKLINVIAGCINDSPPTDQIRLYKKAHPDNIYLSYTIATRTAITQKHVGEIRARGLRTGRARIAPGNEIHLGGFPNSTKKKHNTNKSYGISVSYRKKSTDDTRNESHTKVSANWELIQA